MEKGNQGGLKQGQGREQMGFYTKWGLGVAVRKLHGWGGWRGRGPPDGRVSRDICLHRLPPPLLAPCLIPPSLQKIENMMCSR